MTPLYELVLQLTDNIQVMALRLVELEKNSLSKEAEDRISRILEEDVRGALSSSDSIDYAEMAGNVESSTSSPIDDREEEMRRKDMEERMNGGSARMTEEELKELQKKLSKGE